MAPNKDIRDLWGSTIQYLLDRHSRKSLSHLLHEKKYDNSLIFPLICTNAWCSWIMKYFHSADTDGSNSLTKKECRRLLTNSLNVKVPDDIFEELFKVHIRRHLSHFDSSLPLLIDSRPKSRRTSQSWRVHRLLPSTHSTKRSLPHHATVILLLFITHSTSSIAF